MFGCDGDADPGYWVFCFRCRGDAPDRSCTVCEGTGKIRLTECPTRIITAEVDAMHEAFVHYRVGFLPTAGGMLDQTPAFRDGVRLLATLYAHHEEIESKRG